MNRRDLAFPLRIVAGQAATSPYALHVAQMIRQVLLTDPGERVCLPTFGAGLRRLLFAPIASGIESTTELAVRQALDQWLAGEITVQAVRVTVPEEGKVAIEVSYELTETRETHSETVEIGS
jgi:phage baseplate assembly protein W